MEMGKRMLRPGERLPSFPPRRYKMVNGYWLLRWKMPDGQYVECYEHRVAGDRVTKAEHIHHKNGDPGDNRPENLEEMTLAEHAEHHGAERTIDRTEILRLYVDEGLTSTAVGEQLGCHPSVVSRALAEAGVPARASNSYRPPTVDADEVVRLFMDGMRPQAIADQLGCSRTPVDTALRRRGIPPHRPGRPSR